MRRVLAIGALALALTGCGTAQNFRRESPLDAEPYGGVKIASERLGDEVVAASETWPLRAADVALSAAGDTVTLPVTASLKTWRIGQRLVYVCCFYDNAPPARDERRKSRFDDPPAPDEQSPGSP